MPSEKARRFVWAKFGVAGMLFFGLLIAGLRGRQHARVLAALNEVTSLRKQLQQSLDGAALREPLFRHSTFPAPSDNPEVARILNELKSAIQVFQTQFAPNGLLAPEDLELRLSQATVANVEQRFHDSLTVVPESGKQAGDSRTALDDRIRARVLQVRGDAFFGLRDWRNAWDTYRELLALRPGWDAAQVRTAQSLDALGQRTEAIRAYAAFARSQHRQGNDLLLEGDQVAASLHYDSAVALQTQLLEEPGQIDLARPLALMLGDRGNVFLLQGKADLARSDYEKAIAIYSRLIGTNESHELLGELALGYNNRGNAWLMRGRPDAAGEDYAKALAIYTQLMEQAHRQDVSEQLAATRLNLGNASLGQQKLDAASSQYEQAISVLSQKTPNREIASDLAMGRNNHGAILWASGKVESALADFEQAVNVLTPFGKIPDETARVSGGPDRAGMDQLRLRLDAFIGFSDKSLDVLTRTRIVEDNAGVEPAVALGICLRNRGYIQMTNAKWEAAVADFKKSIEIYGRLAEQHGQSDLVPQLAKSLTPAAWLLATCPDNAWRNGPQAQAYAAKACELVQWKIFAPLESLAAASAELGNFADAVKWQEKALELCPAARKPEVRSRLDAYRAGRPYRLGASSA